MVSRSFRRRWLAGLLRGERALREDLSFHEREGFPLGPEKPGLEELVLFRVGVDLFRVALGLLHRLELVLGSQTVIGRIDPHLDVVFLLALAQGLVDRVLGYRSLLLPGLVE